MAETIQLTVDLLVSTERVYRAWFDGYETSQFTGSPAEIDARVGGRYSLDGGVVHGHIIVMTPFSHFTQTWRASYFPAGSPDSRVDVTLEPTCLGCQVHLTHSDIPRGQSGKVMDWWIERYLKPLRDYFEALVGESPVDMDG